MHAVFVQNFELYMALGCWSDYFRNCSQLSEDMEEYTLYGRHRLDKDKVRLSVTLSTEVCKIF